MRLTRNQKPPHIFFQAVPLLDVIFALLVFFILSSTFILQPGISVRLPASNFALEPSRNPLVISMVGSSAGLPRLFFRDQVVTDGELPKILADPSFKGRTIILKADRTVPYEWVLLTANQILEQNFQVVLATESPKK